MPAKERFEIIKGVLHAELERLDQAFENYLSWADFERLMKELEGEDGEVSFETFLSWMGGDRTKGTLAKIVKTLADMDARDADAAELAAQSKVAEKVAARVAAIDSIFTEMEPDERRRVSAANFERIGEICGGIELSHGDKKRALRSLDPTSLGFIKETAYLAWMEEPRNRLGPKLLAGLTAGQPEAEDGADFDFSIEPSSPTDVDEVSQLCRYLFDCLDLERDGEYLPIEALQRIPDVAGVKLSKAEKASLNSNHILDPDRLHDCYIGNLDEWLWSDEKLPKKVMAALQNESGSGTAIPRGISEDFAAELKQSRIVQEQFEELSGSGDEMQTDSLVQLSDLHGISRAEVSRCAAALDPEETGVISIETWTAWMNESDNQTAAAIFGHVREVAGGGDQVSSSHVESKLTDEELKSLFLMLNEAGDGHLTKADWAQVDLILNIQCSEDEIEMAMREMGRFAKADGKDDQGEDDDSTAKELAKKAAAEHAAENALGQPDAWIILKVRHTFVIFTQLH